MSLTEKIVKDYELVEPYSSSKRSEVYLARRSKSDQLFFLKTLNINGQGCGSDLDRRIRLKHEIDLVSSFEHKNISSLIDFHTDQNNYYLVYPYQKGNQLSSLLSLQTSLGMDNAMHLIFQLLSALEYIHHKGVVHGGVNPSNIFITSEKKLELFDFGHSINETETPYMSTSAPQGEPPYAAPEQLGFKEFQVDTRTDIYCASMILYQMLSGRVPFKSNQDCPEAFLEFALKKEVEPIKNIPLAFNQILVKGLNPNPSERYQTATGLIYDLQQARRGGVITGPGDSFAVGHKDSVISISRKRLFVGRSLEMKLLNKGLNKLFGGGSYSQVFYGLSGIGKTEIVNEFANSLMKDRFSYYSTKCNRYTSNQPYSVFRSIVVDGLKSLIHLDVSAQNRVLEVLNQKCSRNSGLICHVIPELKELFKKIQPVEEVEDEKAASRLVAVLYDLMKEVISLKPSVVFIDDAQWMDVTSFKILKKAIEEKLQGLFVFNYRTSPNHQELFVGHEDIRSLPISSVVEIRPFTEEDIEEMIVLRFGDLKEHALFSKVLISKSGGVPFVLTEAIRYLVNHSYLKLDSRGWSISEEDLLGLPDTFDKTSMIMSRLEALPIEASQFLKIAALLEGRFLREQISYVGGFEKKDTRVICQTLVNAGLIIREKSGAYHFSHDIVQEVVASSIPEEQALILYGHFGYFSQQKIEEDPQYIQLSAENFLRSKNLEMAVLTCFQAGQYAQENFGLDQSIYFYQMCLLMGGRMRSQAFRVPVDLNEVREKLGTLLIHNGQYKQALKIFLENESTALNQSRMDKISYHFRIGCIYQSMGKFQIASDYLTRALVASGIQLPYTPIGRFFAGTIGVLKQLGLSLGFRNLIPKKHDRHRITQVRLLNKLSQILYFLDTHQAYLAHLKAINIAESLVDCYEKAEAFSLHIIPAYGLRMKARARRFQKRAARISQIIGRTEVIASYQLIEGMAHFCGSKWELSRRLLIESARNQERIGDFRGRIMAIETLITIFFRQGLFTESKQWIEKNIQLSQSVHDNRGLFIAQWQKAYVEKIFGKENSEHWKNIENKCDDMQDRMSKSVIKSSIADRYHLRGERIKAFQTIEIALQDIENQPLNREGISQIYSVGCDILVSEGMDRKKGQTILSLDKKVLNKTFRSWIIQLWKRGRRFPAWKYRTYLYAAWYCHFKNLNRISELFFLRSLRLAKKFESRYGEGRVREDYSRFLESQFQPTRAKDQMALAQSRYQACHALADLDRIKKSQSSESIPIIKEEFHLDPSCVALERRGGGQRLRLDALLNVCHSINDIQDVDLLLKQIVQAMIKATGSQNGFLFLNTNEVMNVSNIYINKEGRDLQLQDIRYSVDILRWVRANMKPMLVKEPESEERIHIREDDLVRSVLCVPLIKEERYFGCAYLSNDKVPDFFNQSAEQVASIIAVQASILIENAILIKNYKDLNAHLEATIRRQTQDISEKNKELGKYNLKLVESERMKSMLTGTVVHDIKNLVAGVEGNLKVLTRKFECNVKGMRSIKTATDACMDIVSLTSNLLDIGKMEDGKLEILSQTVPVSYLVQIVQKLTKHQGFVDKEIDMTILGVDEPHEISCDIRLMERVFQNLVSNAAKYTSKGGRVIVEFKKTTDEFIISVFNSGPPIADEYKSTLFDKYVRLSDHWSPYSKGLGLFFCRQVMKAHNGRAWLDTDERGNYFNLGFRE